MRRIKELAAALAVVVLVVPSAFAEFRHSHETRGHDSARSTERHDRSSDTRTFDRGSRAEHSYRDNNNNNNYRNNNTYRENNYRNNTTYRDNNYRNNSTYRDNSYRNNNSYRNDYRGSSRGSFDRGRPFFHEGRVTRYERWNGGYRVWLGGIAYPFFIPEARFRLFPRFSVGLSIRLGGYYNPLGYYDYYDGPYDGYYSGYSSPAYVAGELHGIVESVDYRRGTVLVRDTASDRIVNAVMRGDDPRFGDLRIGDYVELSGDWTRISTFDAYRVYNHDTAGYRYYER